MKPGYSAALPTCIKLRFIQIARVESSASGSGLVGKYLRSIDVVDANGDEIVVHEYEERDFLTKKHRFSLETGELVERLGRDKFVVIESGEELHRI